MESAISAEDKKLFIRWFLKRYKLKRRECVWILNYLLSHEHLLQNVHFTDEAHYCPRAMVMSVTGSESIPFRFYKGNLMTADAEKGFHDLRLHPEDKMHIQLNFPNSHSCPQYASVREENPFLPTYLQVSEDDKKIAEELLSEIAEEAYRNNIMILIDKALDDKDEEMFMLYSGMLKKFKSEKKLKRNKTISFSA